MKKIIKQRLDVLLVEKGFSDSRNRAQALIMAGKVRVNNQVVNKSGTLINPEDNILIENSDDWASRGAKKLLKAFEVFDIKVNNKICIDLGASTGGFTDVLLKNNALKIYAVDVGYGQLIWRLANNEKVIVMDRTNARYLTHENFNEIIDFGTCDVSFISLKLIIPVLDDVLNSDYGEAVVLIKPQFEAGRENLNRDSHGVIKDKKIHVEVLNGICDFIDKNTKFFISGLTHSPIRGPEGNIEFLCWLTRINNNYEINTDNIVNLAHKDFS